MIATAPAKDERAITVNNLKQQNTEIISKMNNLMDLTEKVTEKMRVQG